MGDPLTQLVGEAILHLEDGRGPPLPEDRHDVQLAGRESDLHGALLLRI